jgi:type 1 glutamine amidotransferase
VACLVLASCGNGGGMQTGADAATGAGGTSAFSGAAGSAGGSAGAAGVVPGGATGGPSGGSGGVAGDGPPAAVDGGGAGGSSAQAGAGGEAGNAGGGGSGSGGRGGAPAPDGGADRPDGATGADAPARPMRVLLYSFSTLDIPSVPAQLATFRKKLEGWQYQVDESKDPAAFTDAALAKYAAVAMINTCFYPFGANNAGAAESQALQRFVQRGGGLFGTHCADVTFQSVNPPPLYNQLIGGRANSDNYTGNNTCRTAGAHPTIAGLPATFTYNGNLDNAAFVATDATVLVRCKFGGGSGADTAVSWLRNEGTGRVFFTGFGKVDTDLTNGTIGEAHILAGLGWVLGR